MRCTKSIVTQQLQRRSCDHKLINTTWPETWLPVTRASKLLSYWPLCALHPNQGENITSVTCGCQQLPINHLQKTLWQQHSDFRDARAKGVLPRNSGNMIKLQLWLIQMSPISIRMELPLARHLSPFVSQKESTCLKISLQLWVPSNEDMTWIRRKSISLKAGIQKQWWEELSCRTNASCSLFELQEHIKPHVLLTAVLS